METSATLVIGKNYNKIDDNMAFHFQIAKEARHDITTYTSQKLLYRNLYRRQRMERNYYESVKKQQIHPPSPTVATYALCNGQCTAARVDGL